MKKIAIVVNNSWYAWNMRANLGFAFKNKGYEDALCRLDSNKATVIVKSATALQENETVAIQEIVQDVSKIKDVIIEVQK